MIKYCNVYRRIFIQHGECDAGCEDRIVRLCLSGVGFQEVSVTGLSRRRSSTAFAPD